MIKNESEDEVIESAKDLLSNEDTAADAFKKSELTVDVQNEKYSDSNIKEERPGWDNRLQYILAQVGFSVGLGNVWRFPYLCQKNGGVMEPECGKSSATTYYLYRKALNVSGSISESGGLNWKMTFSLLVTWAMVCFAIIKGIQSSVKIVYFSTLSPYVVLTCFLVRTLFLKGSIYGIRHMFTPQLEKLMEPQTWKEAATQVFFALDLGFGGVIAFSSYNKKDNNCQFDANLVPLVNFFTSILATLVVFAVLGFKASVLNERCIEENTIMIHRFLKMGKISQAIISSHVIFSAEDYHKVYDIIKRAKGEEFPALNLKSCYIEDELNKEVQGVGLAFITFTEAMTHFPLAPFWSVMFFLMLISLGFSSMFGIMEGIITPMVDSFKVRKELVTDTPRLTTYLFSDHSHLRPSLQTKILTDSLTNMIA